MALVLNDRVKETTTTTGTGTINLAGAETGFETFVQGVGNSNTTYYAIVHTGANEFEVGLGTVTDASPDTLSRTTIISSTNSDAAVDFSAGTKNVFCTLPASKATVRDSNDNITFADNDKILFGAGTDLAIFSDGTNGKVEATGDLTLDVAGNLNLDADGGSITFKDDGLLTATLARSVANFEVTVNQSDGDFVLKGNDGGSALTAITVDMSNGGEAIFYGGIDIAANTDIELNYGSWTGEKAAKIQAHGNNMYTQYTTYLVGRNSSGTDTFLVDASGNGYFIGNVTAYHSDERLKDRQGKIKNALDKVSQIETFYYKGNELAKSLGRAEEKKQVGVSAQSVKAVLPEIVELAPFDMDTETGKSKSGEDYMTVDYARLTPLLIEAIKELQAKVKELEDK